MYAKCEYNMSLSCGEGSEAYEMYVCSLFVILQDVAMLVEDYVEGEFNMVCEDGSPDEIGEIVVTMYRQCAEGDFSLVNTTLAREKVRQNVVGLSSGLEAGGDVLDDSEGGPSSEMNTIVEEEVVAFVPEVDGEGFETVARGKRTRSGKRFG